MKWPDVPPAAVLLRVATLLAVLVLLMDALLFGGHALEKACRVVLPALDRAALVG